MFYRFCKLVRMARAYCSDCGDAPVNHRLYKINTYSEAAALHVSYVLRPFEILAKKIVGALRISKLALPFFTLLHRLHLGVLADHFREGDSIRTKALFEGAATLGIKLWHFRPFNQASDAFFIAKLGREVHVFDIMPRPKGSASRSLLWMDDKGRLKKEFVEAGIPIAKGAVCTTLAQAKEVARQHGFPLIAKPTLGSRGRHTTVGITSYEDLERAFSCGRELTPWVLVEQELQGIVHRVTLIGGKVAGVVKRDAPGVLGDGKHTVRELMEIENRDPRRDDFSFYKIAPNERAERELSRQKLTWDSKPTYGQYVILNDKISRLHGTVTIDLTEKMHPENRDLFEGVIHNALQDPLVGIDFMIDDITRSWREQERCGVVECNAVPYIDLHHYPFEGASRNVAALLWQEIFPSAKRV